MSCSVFVTGDFCPAGDQSSFTRDISADLETLYGSGLELIRQADIAITNLECPLTDYNRPFPKIGPYLKASPQCIRSIAGAGFGLVTLANNHIYDYGRQGLADTLAVCREHQLQTVGAGETLHQARQTWFTDVAGHRLAVVNFAENEWSSATSHHGGSHPMDIIENVRTIKTALLSAEFVLVIIHGGNEWCTYPSPRVVEQYRFYAEQGASAIVAHHPHCIQGYEVHRDVPIFYSLGNFLFPTSAYLGPLWHNGYAVRLVFTTGRKPAFEIFPYEQSLGQTTLEWYDSQQKKDFMERLDDISEPLGDMDRLTKLWQKQVDTTASRFLWYLSHGSKFSQAIREILRYFGLLDKIVRMGKKRNRLRLHLVRCEAHRDVIIRALEQAVGNEEP